MQEQDFQARIRGITGQEQDFQDRRRGSTGQEQDFQSRTRGVRTGQEQAALPRIRGSTGNSGTRPSGQDKKQDNRTFWPEQEAAHVMKEHD
jgi:hypothetical protein